MSLNSSDGYSLDFSENLAKFSVRKLCEIIIVARYLGSMNTEAIQCMEELARRRTNGDDFDYETFIENETKKLPEFKINLKKKMQISGFDLSMLRTSK